MAFQVFAPSIILCIVAELITGNIHSTKNQDEPFVETKFSEALDHSKRIILSWELGDNKSVITFELWAQTVGYVGFGISPNGGMAGADIFIAGVAPDGTPYSSDRFASANELPKIDSHQDWTLLEAKENKTTTYLKFSRLVGTCDKNEDYPISKGTNRVIWAIGPTDDFVKHSSMDDRGSRSISFFNKRPKLIDKSGLETWIAKVELEMPSKETTNWCTIHAGFPLDIPKYLVAHEVYLPDQQAINHIHHMVLYKCSLPEDGSFDKTIEALTVDNGFRGYLCSDIIDSLVFEYCHSKTLLPSAKGDQTLVLPNNVAFKFEKEADKKLYFLLDSHIDNPGESKGVLLNFGLKVFYSDKPRQYDATVAAIVHGTAHILIPPNTRDFVYQGHCSSVCTQKLDPSGISIFNVLLHAHVFATKLKLRHFRNDIELPWIASDDKYDFNYQQSRMLDEERKVLPGDRLTIECSYDTTSYNGKVVVGGSSSINEMCQAIIWYYPSNDNLLDCWSYSHDSETLALWNITKYNYTGDNNFGSINIEEPADLQGNFVDFLNHKFTWSDDFKKQFQEKKVQQDQIVGCRSISLGGVEEATFSYPKSSKEFVPEEETYCTASPLENNI